MTYNDIPETKEYIDGMRIDKSPHTITTYVISINLLLEFTGAGNLSDIKNITPQKLREYQNYLKNEKNCCHSTINTRIRPIRSMYNWMIEQEYLETSPVKKVKDLKVDKTIPAFLSEEEIDAMIMACKNDLDRLIIALLVTTGMRRNEIITLKLSDYDGSHITIHGKGGKERKLILQDDIIDLLDKWIDKRNKKYGNINDYIFVSKMRTKFDGSSILEKVKNVMKLANFTEERIEQIHTHSLRHTFVANLFESGADIYTAQQALGHEKLETTMLYAHLRNSALDKSMSNMKSVLHKGE